MEKEITTESTKKQIIMIKRKNRTLIFFISCFFSTFLSSCQPTWEIELISGGQKKSVIDESDVRFYSDKTDDEKEMIVLGQLFFASGFSLIDEISLYEEDMEIQTFVWDDIAKTSVISETGKITINDSDYYPTEIMIEESTLATEIEYSIMDIAPSMAYALDLPELSDAIGEARWDEKTDYGVMILLDGLQFTKLTESLIEGQLPFLESLYEIKPGLTVFPPRTRAVTGAVITGTAPKINGVYGYGYRSTEIPTLFDIADENALNIIAVEGASLPFNLRSAEIIISGDRDGNGYTDDNVLINSLEVIRTKMPDLMYIHFHDIDDMGHKYGPESQEYKSALIRVDGYLEDIYEALPDNTFIVIFADHGMHKTTDGGNHGTLTASDIIIPVIFIEK